MANMDLGYGAAGGERPQAIIGAYRRSLSEELSPSRPAAQRLPKFSRIDGGQLFRTAILVALCFGIVQLSRPEGAPPKTDGAAAAQKRL